MISRNAILLLFLLLAVLALPGCTEGSAEEPTGTQLAENPLAKINRFAPGAFEDPSVCGDCHVEIYEQWSRSKHRYAWEDEFFQPDFLRASRETGGFTDIFCGECHTPPGVRTGQLPPPDGSRLDNVSRQGISCDYCHTVKAVESPFNVQTISAPGMIKRGPRGDGVSYYHEVEFSRPHTEASFCGACHNVKHPVSGVMLIDTYEDWKAGPFAEKGVRCQDCHMTPTPGVGRNPGQSAYGGLDRDHVATHSFIGGSAFFHERAGNDEYAEQSREMLKAAAQLDAEVSKVPDGLRLVVRVNNTGAGHKIPTGVAYIRKMWIEVTVKDGSDAVVYASGHLTNGNQVDPGAVFYRVLFQDAQGNLTNKSWLAEKIAYDRRIPAQGSDEQVFDIPVQGKEFNITVRLLYRSMSQEDADGFGMDGLEVPSIEMARAELTVR